MQENIIAFFFQLIANLFPHEYWRHWIAFINGLNIKKVIDLISENSITADEFQHLYQYFDTENGLFIIISFKFLIQAKYLFSNSTLFIEAIFIQQSDAFSLLKILQVCCGVVVLFH